LILEHEAILIAISQVAVAFIGFTGVVSVLGRRNQGTWTPEERLQLRVLVEVSLTALFGSLSPFLFAELFDAEITVLMASNGLLGAFHASNFVAFSVRTRSAKPTRSQRILGVVGILTILAHIIAALGLIDWLGFVLIFGLIQQLIVASHNFVLLLFPISSSP